ncbi:6656_t:CDS:1 [Paraglomus brasilianum]|uniref:6656_t:CDS:1 n=1 Tax=Paraglomus brasilianum TaxID=144538 RepID=A0A9N9FSG5_9GLOM|nr:6656_t:CDS:1 [Paraglomus brasilianum]
MDKHSAKSAPKRILSKIFTNSKKNSSVSPTNEWTPEWMATISTSNDDSNWYSTAMTHATLAIMSTNEQEGTRHVKDRHDEENDSKPSMPRRYSFSTVHDNGKQRLVAAKRAEYQAKMQAFDELIQRRRGSTLRMALAPDVTC